MIGIVECNDNNNDNIQISMVRHVTVNQFSIHGLQRPSAPVSFFFLYLFFLFFSLSTNNRCPLCANASTHSFNVIRLFLWGHSHLAWLHVREWFTRGTSCVTEVVHLLNQFGRHAPITPWRIATAYRASARALIQTLFTINSVQYRL